MFRFAPSYSCESLLSKVAQQRLLLIKALSNVKASPKNFDQILKCHELFDEKEIGFGQALLGDLREEVLLGYPVFIQRLLSVSLFYFGQSRQEKM